MILKFSMHVNSNFSAECIDVSVHINSLKQLEINAFGLNKIFAWERCFYLLCIEENGFWWTRWKKHDSDVSHCPSDFKAWHIKRDYNKRFRQMCLSWVFTGCRVDLILFRHCLWDIISSGHWTDLQWVRWNCRCHMGELFCLSGWSLGQTVCRDAEIWPRVLEL